MLAPVHDWNSLLELRPLVVLPIAAAPPIVGIAVHWTTNTVADSPEMELLQTLVELLVRHPLKDSVRSSSWLGDLLVKLALQQDWAFFVVVVVDVFDVVDVGVAVEFGVAVANAVAAAVDAEPWKHHKQRFGALACH